MKTAWLVALLGIVLAMPGARAQRNERSSPVIRHEYATVNGVKLHYVTEGQGQVILFLHGFPEFWYEWKNQLAEFGKDYQAVAPDMRGYNLSDKPAKVEDYAVPLLVQDIRALLEKLSKGRKAILIAHDWGGALAWIFAARYPEMLEKLVIINAPHPTIFARELRSNPKQQQASSYMTFFQSEGAEKALSANNYAMLGAAVFTTNRQDAFSEEDKRAYRAAWAQPGALTGGLNYYRASNLAPPANTDTGTTDGKGTARKESAFASEPLPIVQMPTLVIWGEKDSALLTGNLDGLDKAVKSLTIKRIPSGGHWIVHEEPKTVNAAIREFLRSAK